LDDLLNIIGNVGFPIAVSAYLLIRIENKLGELTEAIGELRETIITLPHNSYRDPPGGFMPVMENARPQADSYPTV